MTEDVNGHDRPGARSYFAFEISRINVVGVALNVDENRQRAFVKKGIDAGGECKRRHQDLIAGTDSECLDDQMQRGSARAHRNCVLRSGITRDRLFELDSLRPKCKSLAPQYR